MFCLKNVQTLKFNKKKIILTFISSYVARLQTVRSWKFKIWRLIDNLVVNEYNCNVVYFKHCFCIQLQIKLYLIVVCLAKATFLKV